MEVKLGKTRSLNLLIREMIGTAMLLSAINISGGNAKAVAGTIFAAIMTLAGPLCGGHFNPAVTIGVLVSEGIAENFKMAIAIIISQIIGGFAGVGLARMT